MRRSLLAMAVVLGLMAHGAGALSPENLLLIVNKNVPEGGQLAKYYSEKRKVPADRILELDLPTTEEISFGDYENRVVPQVRDFIARNKLTEQVTCLVTFYGVPLKIAARVNTPGDQVELAAVKQELKAVMADTATAVVGVEGLAKEMDPTFAPGADLTLPGLMARDQAARQAMARAGAKVTDPAKIDSLNERAMNLVRPLSGSATLKQQRMHDLATYAARWTPKESAEAIGLRDELVKMRAQFDALQARRGDPASRSQVRQLVKEQLGLLEYGNLLHGMADYFVAENTDAAFDSELAVVNWNYYARQNYLPNPLNYRAQQKGVPQVLMTMRLDGPQSGTARDIIVASLKAQAEGLSGRAVVDAGGNLTIDAKNPAYAAFDRRLQELAGIIRDRTKIPLTFDDRPAVLPARSVKDPVALYCGWYALQNYTPPGTFVPGAVGYHTASFEMTTLRVESRQWCRGLLVDGIAATIGPVNEPYLQAFPPPEEFFPLLMTGKLTLAEVYWKTNPMVSWRMAIIGDPLYNPFEAKAALTIDGLPFGLRAALGPAVP